MPSPATTRSCASSSSSRSSSSAASDWLTAAEDDDSGRNNDTTTRRRGTTGSDGGANDGSTQLRQQQRRRRAKRPTRRATTTTVTAPAVVATPPTYPQRPHTTQHHGHTRHDPYHWLRNRKDARVRRLLRRENAYTEHFFRTHAPTHLRRTLYREMRARCADVDASLPTLERRYWYYTRHEPGQEHACYCRRPYDAARGVNVDFADEVSAWWRRHPTAPLPAYDDEVVFLDLNALQRQLRLRSVDVGDMDVSPDDTTLALTLDCSDGAEEYALFVLPIVDVRRHAATSSSSSLRARHTVLHRLDALPLSSEVVWVGHRALLALALDAKQRPHQLLYYDLDQRTHSSSSNDDDNDAATTCAPVVCYTEPDEAFWLGALGYSSDERYVLFSTASGDVTEWYACATCADAVGVAHDAVAAGDVAATDTTLRVLPGAPRVCTSSTHAASTHAAAYCVARRCATPSPVEYDLDHHNTLLAPHTGAWLLTSNAHGCTNFAVFFVVDKDDDDDDGSGALQACAHTDDWRLLFEYSDAVNVQGVECLRAMLLVSVRRRGSPTVLLCPVALLHRWWRDGATRPVALDALTDLSRMCARMHALGTCRRNEQHPDDDTSSGDDDADGSAHAAWAWHSFACSTRPHVACTNAQQEQQENSDVGKHDDDDDDKAAVSATVALWRARGLRCTSLPWCVEAYTYTSSFDSTQWRVHVSHLLHPDVVYVCTLAPHDDEHADMLRLRLRRLREHVVHGPVRYDAAAYDGAVVWVPSDYSFAKQPHADAHAAPTHTRASRVHVPVQLCWSRARVCHDRGGNGESNDGVAATGEAALLLRVYGSYGECSDGEFAPERLSLLDRGVMCGLAAVRGGGELGVAWRDAGRKLQRGTSVNDFVSVASYLQDMHVCAPHRLVAAGDSAGGFIVCAALNRAPQLFHGVVAAVPFVDCLATLLDDTLPLTVTEWDECGGDPRRNADAYAMLCALSPVESVPTLPRVVLPHVLLLTAWRDSRVGYWESLKLTARLRALWRRGSAQAGRVLLHYCDFDGVGHTGATGRYAHLRELAREYAFVLHICTCADLAPRTTSDGDDSDSDSAAST